MGAYFVVSATGSLLQALELELLSEDRERRSINGEVALVEMFSAVLVDCN